MRAWFDGLEDRERIFVLAAAVFVLFSILYFGIWMPLDRGHKNAAASVEDWQESLAEIGVLQRYAEAGATGQSASGADQSLVVVVANTLRGAGLSNSLQRSQPSGNTIRIEFENVAFDDLIAWLGELSNSYGLEVQSGSFSNPTGEDEGRVNATLTLER